MQIGEEYMVTTDSTVCDTNNIRHPIRGRVVYVHPLGRFAVLEFKCVNGNIRESYFPEQLTTKNRVK